MLNRLPLIAALVVACLSADAFAGHSSKNNSSCKTSNHNQSNYTKKKSGFSFRIQIGNHSNHNNYNHSKKKYIAGHWETRRIRYCVTKACYKYVTYPAVYEVRYDDCGHAYRVMVRPETRRRVYYPAKYDYRTVRHYVPGRWVICSN